MPPLDALIMINIHEGCNHTLIPTNYFLVRVQRFHARFISVRTEKNKNQSSHSCLVLMFCVEEHDGIKSWTSLCCYPQLYLLYSHVCKAFV